MIVVKVKGVRRETCGMSIVVSEQGRTVDLKNVIIMLKKIQPLFEMSRCLR